MTTMSDDGEKTCPICAEEMDLTDQQLKPCKCGYEICVWCWHHINEMAEKQDSKGRCPACRTPYDKDRIVGMAANCERVLAETNAERRQKPQKGKLKTSTEARKHLTSVRVIQRNLVYIIGLPSSLADESILERKEYFGQYGKVLKVSISRPAATATQQASNNNTFSVYITYVREEEAVRCIQAVHNFVLEGKPLRACFGTTKYCHSWLRNMTCSNPDCLYLHDIGSQEDSFTKDEIISAYTRSRVPQIASNNLQRRAGNILPPADDLCNNGAVSTKHVLKSASTNSATQIKNSNSTGGGKSTGLPAAASWGLHSSNSRPAANVSCLQSSVKQKAEIISSSCSSSSVLSSTKQTSAWHDDAVRPSKIPEGRHVNTDCRFKPLEPIKPGIEKDYQTTVSNVLPEAMLDTDHTPVSAWDDDDDITVSIPEARLTNPVDSRSRPTETLRATVGSDCPTPAFDVSAETVSDISDSAWNGDIIMPLKIPEGRQLINIGGKIRSSGTLKPGIARDCQTPVLDVSTNTARDAAHGSSSLLPAAPEDKDGGTTVSRGSTSLMNGRISEGLGGQPSGSGTDNSFGSTAVNGNTESLCSATSSLNLNSQLGADLLKIDQYEFLASDHCLPGMLDLRLQQCHHEQHLTSAPLGKASLIPDAHLLGEFSDWRLELQKPILSSTDGIEDSLAPADDQIQRLSDITNSPLNITNRSTNISQNVEQSYTQFSDNGNFRTKDTEIEQRFCSLRNNGPVCFNGQKQEIPSSSSKLEEDFEYSDITYTETELKFLGKFDDVVDHTQTAKLDTGGGGIISDILSLDFDPWNDSLSLANDFAKLLGEMDKQDAKLSSSWKLQNCSQSRFSFARQENQTNCENSSRKDIGYLHNSFPSSEYAYGECYQNSFPINGFEGPNALVSSSSSVISSDRTASVARAKISAPPGFSVPKGAPPPGFSSQENLLLRSSHQNELQVQSTVDADVEFIDPAILAVGKGRLPLGVNNSSLGLRSTFPSTASPSEGDTRLQLLMQQSISANQDPGISDNIGDRFLHFNDAYISSSLSAQNSSIISPFAQISHQQPSHILNRQWNGWNDVQTCNGLGMADILRNDRFGLNNYYSVNEGHKFHIPTGDLYNRAFGL